jgi:hypothetical protein
MLFIYYFLRRAVYLLYTCAIVRFTLSNSAFAHGGTLAVDCWASVLRACTGKFYARVERSFDPMSALPDFNMFSRQHEESLQLEASGP